METGVLGAETAASLCRRLADESRTGCLHITGHVGHDRPEVRIYLREGRLHTARADTGMGRLGDRLVGGGHLTADQLAMALQVQDDDGGAARLGDVLVRAGMVPREVLVAVLRDQVLDAISVPLSWTAGTWSFADGEAVREDNPLGMGVQDALMEGARRLGQLEAIRAHMGSEDAVVDFRATGGSASLSLRPDEWAMLTQIDGRASVREIAARAGYSELEAARIIYGLLSTGVVGVVDSGADVPAGPVADDVDPVVAAEAAPPDYLAELESLGQVTRPSQRDTAAEPPPHEAPPPDPADADASQEGPAQAPSPTAPSWSTPAPPPRAETSRKRGVLDRLRGR